MDEEQLVKKIEQEGFKEVFVWEDGPLARYPEHAHETFTTHVILRGEMTIEAEGEEKTYGVGDRIDIPIGSKHSATMGPDGCRYIIGQ